MPTFSPKLSIKSTASTRTSHCVVTVELHFSKREKEDYLAEGGEYKVDCTLWEKDYGYDGGVLDLQNDHIYTFQTVTYENAAAPPDNHKIIFDVTVATNKLALDQHDVEQIFARVQVTMPDRHLYISDKVLVFKEDSNIIKWDYRKK